MHTPFACILLLAVVVSSSFAICIRQFRKEKTRKVFNYPPLWLGSQVMACHVMSLTLLSGVIRTVEDGLQQTRHAFAAVGATRRECQMFGRDIVAQRGGA